MKLPGIGLISFFILTSALALSAYCAGVSQTAKQPEDAWGVPKSEIINNGREPGDYYTLPFSDKKVKLPSGFKDEAEIIAFVGKELGKVPSPDFYEPNWCAVLLDRGSGIYTWDVLFFEKSSNLKETKPWQLRRIYNTPLWAERMSDWPALASMSRGANKRILVFKNKNDRKMATLGIPAPAK